MSRRMLKTPWPFCSGFFSSRSPTSGTFYWEPRKGNTMLEGFDDLESPEDEPVERPRNSRSERFRRVEFILVTLLLLTALCFLIFQFVIRSR